MNCHTCLRANSISTLVGASGNPLLIWDVQAWVGALNLGTCLYVPDFALKMQVWYITDLVCVVGFIVFLVLIDVDAGEVYALLELGK